LQDCPKDIKAATAKIDTLFILIIFNFFFKSTAKNSYAGFLCGSNMLCWEAHLFLLTCRWDSVLSASGGYTG
jgi:hypothetical protein